VHIEFSFSRSAEYFYKQLTAGAKQRIKPLAYASVALVLAGVIIAVCTEAAPLGVIAGLDLLLLAVLLFWIARRRFHAAVTVSETWTIPRRYLITDGGLESSTDHTSMKWDWQVVHLVTVESNAYLFWQDGGPMFDVPREPLTPEQEAQLRAFLEARGFLPSS